MVTGLLVVLFTVIAVLVGRLAYTSGHDTGYDLGFDDSQMSVRGLEYRNDTLAGLLEFANKRADSLKVECRHRGFKIYLMFAELTKVRRLLGEAMSFADQFKAMADQLLVEGFAYKQLADRLGTENLRLQKERNDDADHIDGLTVDLAMTEAERDQAKAAIEKIMSVQMPLKLAAKLSQIVTPAQ